MIRSFLSSSTVAFALAAALAFAGCASDTSSGQQSGSLNLNLELAEGVVINEVDWTISGGDMEPMSGTIDTSAPGATASVEVFGLPPGDGYLVELEATDASGEISCRGDAEFDVGVGVATDVMVFLNCKRPTTLGGVRVNGKFNICAQLSKVVVSPLQTSVGNDIDLSAQAEDVEDDDISYQWSASTGSIADASVQDTTYTCQETGEQLITITVSDDGGVHCMDDWTVSVVCVDGDGGTGGAGGSAGVGGIGGAGGGGGGAGAGGTGGAGGEGGGGGSDLCEGVVCEGDDCNESECNLETGLCENNPINEDGACESGTGTCSGGVCIDNCAGVVCEDIECNVNACNPFTGECDAEPVDDGVECDDGAGTCQAGVCEPTSVACEYEQDFEALVPGDPPQDQPTSLADDGWRVGANVFDTDGTTFLYDYFDFPAPNGGPAFSAVAVGEGGAEQGAQQLSIYSDYNNADHGLGRIIEALVFQGRAIVAGDVGTTISFTFDAKAGNIEGSSEALAFIKTLDPDASFATTNFITQDTTNLPDTWGTFTLSLPVDASLVGQILQFGFQTRATNFEGSGVLYDNITVGPEGCAGDGGGGPSGELTINGDFEAGDTSGWEFFPNNGTFAATMAENNGGLWSGNLVASVPAGGGPPSFPVIKQANIGIGTVQPNSTATISFDLFGSVSGAGGVFFAEFFSELSGGGTSSSLILGGGPLFPTGTWTHYTFNTPTGNDVSGGVTLQLKADCGANPGCTVDAFIDNVSVTTP